VQEVTALAIALVGLCTVLAGGLVAVTVFYRGAVRELGNARDRLDAQDIVIATVTDERNDASVKHKLAEDLLARERSLRAIAEAQRNEAQRKVRDLLRNHLAKATDEEIQELTNEVFTSPIALAPRPDGVPTAVPRRSEAGADALLDPFTDLQPSKPA
jgi:hypothetical protein